MSYGRSLNECIYTHKEVRARWVARGMGAFRGGFPGSAPTESVRVMNA